MKVIVTGSTGLVGKELIEILIKQGHEVVGISKKDSFEKPYKKISIDLSDLKQTKRVFEETMPECVIHLAGLLPNAQTGEDVSIMLQNNFLTTLNCLEAALKSGAKYFIFLSTMNVYGKPKYLPVDEKHPVEPNNYYGMSKKLAEDVCKFYSTKGLNTVIFRCSGIYGPSRESGAFAIFLKKALSNENISINSDGSEIWDSVHVKDVAGSIISAMDYVKENKFDVFNIGCGGHGIQMRRLIETIVKITGTSSAIEYKNMPTDLHFVYDISKAKQKLGFNPMSLEEAIKDYAASLKKGLK